MLKILNYLVVVIAVFTFGSASLVAQEKKAAVGGFQSETIGQMEAAGEKLIALAEAMPDETLGWRPNDGVRSSSEVLMHVAQANYFILGIAGMKPPEDLPKEMEKITAKKDVVAHLRRSFEYSSDKIAAIPDKDLEKPVKLFGNDTTVRGVLLLLSIHSHEHLGQLIAYARMNKLTPPWSMPRDQG